MTSSASSGTFNKMYIGSTCTHTSAENKNREAWDLNPDEPQIHSLEDKRATNSATHMLVLKHTGDPRKIAARQNRSTTNKVQIRRLFTAGGNRGRSRAGLATGCNAGGKWTWATSLRVRALAADLCVRALAARTLKEASQHVHGSGNS
ncbi:hypothetical protein D1007_16536 [Hordeum vulgare]|nr:hypothetical protein D1007_16536 [Hordeum vulgare]